MTAALFNARWNLGSADSWSARGTGLGLARRTQGRHGAEALSDVGTFDKFAILLLVVPIKDGRLRLRELPLDLLHALVRALLDEVLQVLVRVLVPGGVVERVGALTLSQVLGLHVPWRHLEHLLVLTDPCPAPRSARDPRRRRGAQLRDPVLGHRRRELLLTLDVAADLHAVVAVLAEERGLGGVRPPVAGAHGDVRLRVRVVDAALPLVVSGDAVLRGALRASGLARSRLGRVALLRDDLERGWRCVDGQVDYRAVVSILLTRTL